MIFSTDPFTILFRHSYAPLTDITIIYRHPSTYDQETTVDSVYNEEYSKFSIMVDDLNEIGAGLSEYLISLKSNYGLGNDLASVLDSYYNGELARDWTTSNPGLSHLTLHKDVDKMKRAWFENDEVVRKSVAHVWINRGLTPMRAFVNTVTPDIEAACQTRENYRKDADSYRRRYQKALQSAQTAQNPDKKAAFLQEQAKLNVKLEAANRRYEEQNVLVKGELEKAKIARDEAIEMMVVTVAACQMELYEQSYKRLVSACSNFPSDKMNQVRENVRNVIRAGGPNPSDLRGGGAASALSAVGNVMIGKNVPSDYRNDRVEREQREADALQKARQTAMEDEAKRKGGAGQFQPSASSRAAPPLPPKGGAGPPSLPPKRMSAAPAPSPAPAAAPSWKRASAPAVPRSAPPAVPARGGPPAIPSRGPPAFGGAGGVSAAAARFGGGGAKAAPPPVPSSRVPPALPKKSAPPPPPKKASAPTCTALYDNVPDDADELGFKAGDRIEIVSKDGEWWTGRLNGRQGIFPANYVQ